MTDIPPDVYWNADASNFYSFPRNEGMGDQFFRTWRGRVAEFPTGPHAPNWCTRYRATTQHGTCLAGVPYDAFHQVPFVRRPCFLTDQAESKPGAVACASLRRPTGTETAMWKTAARGSLERLFTVLAATAEWRDAHQDQDAADIMDCPLCGGRLTIRITKIKNHMGGQCETPNCVSWME